MRGLIALITAVFLLLPVQAQEAEPTPTTPLHITFDPGGPLYHYYQALTEARQSGRQVILDGICLSACAMLTGLIPDDRICITPHAVIGVHSAFEMPSEKYNADGTQLYWLNLSEGLRKLIQQRGWYGNTEQKDMIFLAYPSLRTLYRDCSSAELEQ